MYPACWSNVYFNGLHVQNIQHVIECVFSFFALRNWLNWFLPVLDYICFTGISFSFPFFKTNKSIQNTVNKFVFCSLQLNMFAIKMLFSKILDLRRPYVDYKILNKWLVLSPLSKNQSVYILLELGAFGGP